MYDCWMDVFERMKQFDENGYGFNGSDVGIDFFFVIFQCIFDGFDEKLEN